MAKKTKARRPYKSLAAATEAAQLAEKEVSLLRLATYDIALDRVHWFYQSIKDREGNEECIVGAGVSRLTGSHGGVLTLVWNYGSTTASPQVNTYWLEPWATEAKRRYEVGGWSPERAGEAALAERLLKARHEAQNKSCRACDGGFPLEFEACPTCGRKRAS